MKSPSFIVGDAGGTKTHWRIVKEGSITQTESPGFNAYTHPLAPFVGSVEKMLSEQTAAGLPIYLYAAGIDNEDQAEKVQTALETFHDEKVAVANDLLGVARSLCGHQAGNVCILGTGANACYYDGDTVNKVSSSLGYILGDEGSGAYLGKRFLREVLRDRLPESISEAFQSEFDLRTHQVIEHLYNEPQPNRFLASFAPFIHSHMNDAMVYRLILSSFHEFFNAFFPNVERSNEGFHFCGSIAYYFSDILREVAADRGVVIQTLAQSPIAGLVLYHQENA